MYKVVKTTLEALQRCVAMLETAPNREDAETFRLKIEGLLLVLDHIPPGYIRLVDAPTEAENICVTADDLRKEL